MKVRVARFRKSNQAVKGFVEARGCHLGLRQTTLPVLLAALMTHTNTLVHYFSCYSLLSRYANITHRDPREEPLVKLERWKTEDMHSSNLKVRKTMEKSRALQMLLKVIGVLAVSMVMSDGVLTPAQSILGAVQGLEVIVPNLGNAAVVGTTCGVLVVLFAIQRTRH